MPAAAPAPGPRAPARTLEVFAVLLLAGVSGGVHPLAYAIVKETLPAEKVATGLSMVSVLVGFGAAVGLLLAGPIVDNLGISRLFWTPKRFVTLPDLPKNPAGKVERAALRKLLAAHPRSA